MLASDRFETALPEQRGEVAGDHRATRREVVALERVAGKIVELSIEARRPARTLDQLPFSQYDSRQAVAEEREDGLLDRLRLE